MKNIKELIENINNQIKAEYKGNGMLLLNEIQSEDESNSACTPRNTNKNLDYYI